MERSHLEEGSRLELVELAQLLRSAIYANIICIIAISYLTEFNINYINLNQ